MTNMSRNEEDRYLALALKYQATDHKNEEQLKELLDKWSNDRNNGSELTRDIIAAEVWMNESPAGHRRYRKIVNLCKKEKIWP